MLVDPVAPFESVAVSVMVCVPPDSVEVVNDTPLPIVPSRLLVHTSDAPESVPSSGSDPLPVNDTVVPISTTVLFAGCEICAVGGLFGAPFVVIVMVRQI